MQGWRERGKEIYLENVKSGVDISKQAETGRVIQKLTGCQETSVRLSILLIHEMRMRSWIASDFKLQVEVNQMLSGM